MLAKCWNHEEHKYYVVEIPDGCSYYEHDMDALCVCPSCGARVPFGVMYTSLRYYTLNGIGRYCVCEACHERELADTKGARP
jgi:hypothetical protein